SSILFAFAHYIFTPLHFSWSNFASFFIFAAVASFLYLKSKSLWTPIGFHASGYLFTIL
ncbi:CPBP family intramembrane metalloprotease, partial [bacterium]|nr:CPBP family intramembrane metalloprotease [bacterium]